MRSINEPWEVTQDRPSPYEPVKFPKQRLAPFENAELYVEHINLFNPQAVHRYDENHNMPGKYTQAEIIDGVIWVTFTPEKLGDKYWVSLY